MTERCTSCNRKLYTLKTWRIAIQPYTKGPFETLWPDAVSAFHEKWGWQSKWTPALCRFCDTEHDHRQSPGIRYRLKRAIQNFWKSEFRLA